jgi:lysyl-tRNA synthetase class 2
MTYAAGATTEVLRLRALMFARIRSFFAARGVLEVDTPALSSAGVSDPALSSVIANLRSLGAQPHYLHTSPEYAMKRLLVAGSGDIYQICRVFRDDELGRWHQPEFMLLEWYRLGWDEEQLMLEVEALFDDLVAALPTARWEPSVQVSYAQAFRTFLGSDPSAGQGELVEQLRALGVDVPRELTQDALLDLAFSTSVAPRFPPRALTFVNDFPVSQAALARIKPQTPPVAARFEVFAGGIELANGFAELTDAAEQRRRFDTDVRERIRRGLSTPPLDEAFLSALERGLPACAGVAVGLDRLLAVALGFDRLAPALSFAQSKE